MKVGILSPSIYMHQKYNDRIYAPGMLAILLADALVEAGITVYMFTTSDVKSKATIVSCDDELATENLLLETKQDIAPEVNSIISLYERKKYFEMGLTVKIFEYAKDQKIDIIHSYNAIGNLAHYFLDLFPFPTFFTLHTPAPIAGTIENWRYKKFLHHNFISISNKQKSDFQKVIPGINILRTIYHGVRLSEFDYSSTSLEYLSFMGRMTPEKGVDLTIQIALKTDTDLKLASHINDNITNSTFYQHNILPYLNHSHIDLVGMLSGKEKTDFLKNAKAFLFPLSWEEPFGMTLIESMAVGTPVITFNRGSIPEIVVDGKTGFVVDYKEGVDGLITAVKKLYSLSKSQYGEMRLNCRKHIENNFTEKIMAQNHIKLYQDILKRVNHG